jgi:hypothetical protein
MNERTIIHCDECDSTEVLHERVVAPPADVHLTMSEVVAKAKVPRTVHAVYHYTEYRMVCKGCGHIVRYSV